MHMMYFTEQPMSAYDAQAGLDYGATALTFSNSHYDPVAGSRLYNEYLEEYILAEEYGADGIMLNEHHNAPFCMQAKANADDPCSAAAAPRARHAVTASCGHKRATMLPHDGLRSKMLLKLEFGLFTELVGFTCEAIGHGVPETQKHSMGIPGFSWPKRCLAI